MSDSLDPYLYSWPHSELHKNSKWRDTEAVPSVSFLKPLQNLNRTADG